MGLLDLKTNLKSLKYGNDELGGGDSGQPYIKTDINSGNQIVKKNDDGLIRGGTVGAAKASSNDLLRIGKFLKDAPRGPLFIAKQVGLQLSNPKLESRQFTVDRSTRGNGFFTNVGNLIVNTVNRIANEVGPTRVYNLGVNTLAQVPVNAFGVHFSRHGLLPTPNDQGKYLAVVTANNENGNNRLTKLATKFSLGNTQPIDGTLNTSPKNKGFGILSGVVQTASKIFGFKNPLPSLDANQTIADYIGGPGSVYGIGRTRIARYDNSANLTLIKRAYETSKFYAGNTRVGTINDQGDVTAVPLENNPFFYPITALYTSSSFSKEKWTGNNLIPPPPPSLKNRIATEGQNYINDLSSSYKPISINPNTLGLSNQYNVEESKNHISGSFPQLNQNVIPENSVNPKLKTYQKLKDAIDNQIIDGGNFTEFKGKNNSNTVNYYNALGVSAQYEADALGGTNNVDPDRPLKAPTQIYAVNSKYGNKGQLLTPQQGYETIRDSVEALKTKGNNRDYKFDSKETTILRGSETFKYYGDARTDMNGTRNTYNNTQDFQRIDSDILQIVFRIINPFNNSEDQINFSGYINGFKDDFSATWNEINYAGRAESFYIYDKFKRSVSFNLQIPCFNKKQLFEKHRALGQLAATTAGSYNNNFLGGVLIKLNVGSYLAGEYGILDNLSYSIPDQATWDYDELLAMYLDVSFQFKIINKRLPQYQPKQGFFGYLPDTYPGFITEKGRTDAEQAIIDNSFATG